MNAIYQQQADIQAKIQALLPAIPVGVEDPKNAAAEVTKALVKGGLPANGSGKTGIAMLITTVSAKTSDPDSRTETVLLDFVHRIAIYEQVEANRFGSNGIGTTGLDALSALIGSEEAPGLHGWAQGPGQAPLQFQGFDSDQNEKGVTAWFAEFVLSRPAA